MYIKNIIEETSGEDGESVAVCGELIEVKNAIERLDGQKKTAVILQKDMKNFMVIGGGKEKYVVFAQINGKKYSASNKYDVYKAPIELIVGGKNSEYPSKKCLSLSMVLEAAKHYADRGALAQVFNWETN